VACALAGFKTQQVFGAVAGDLSKGKPKKRKRSYHFHGASKEEHGMEEERRGQTTKIVTTSTTFEEG